MVADDLEFGAEGNNFVTEFFAGFFAKPRRIFFVIFFECRLAVCMELHGISNAAMFFDENFDKADFLKLSRRDHLRNMGMLHPVEPLLVNVVLDIRCYVVDYHVRLKIGITAKQSVFFTGFNEVNAVLMVENYFLVKRFCFFNIFQNLVVNFC